LVGWQFHFLHALVAVFIAWPFELLLRKRLGVQRQWRFFNNPRSGLFAINMLIWLGLAMVVTHDLKVPDAPFKLLTYSFSSFLAMSALVTVFNLLTEEKMK
jgi:hypothetical protein